MFYFSLMLILHCFDIPLIKSKYVPDSIVMAAILSRISYSIRKDKEVAPATPKVKINMNPIFGIKDLFGSDYNYQKL